MNFGIANNYIQRDGFVMVSNLLIQYQQDLGLSNRELMFLIKVMKHKENYKLHDSVLDPTVSQRTLQRCRKSLKDKGYIEFTVWKSHDSNGHIKTEGITYDLSKLEEKLQRISNIKAKRKEVEIENEAKGYILEYSSSSPIAKYLKDWEAHYGDKYKLTAFEKNWYNSLKEDEQKAIGNIFAYCEEFRMFREITPRLVLFAKDKYRFSQIKEYSESLNCYKPKKSEWDLRVEKIIRGEI